MKHTAAVLIVAAGVALAACGSDDAASLTATVPSVEAAAVFNDADIAFAQGMIPHHQQAIEMAGIAVDGSRGSRPEIVDVATRIQAAQDPEIALMTGWLAAWGSPTEMDMDAGHDMEGMMSAEDMTALTTLNGPDFDRRWMEMMIEHHQGAVSMAETVQAQGSSPDVSALAAQIIAGQQAEIDEMQALLQG